MFRNPPENDRIFHKVVKKTIPKKTPKKDTMKKQFWLNFGLRNLRSQLPFWLFLGFLFSNLFFPSSGADFASLLVPFWLSFGWLLALFWRPVDLPVRHHLFSNTCFHSDWENANCLSKTLIWNGGVGGGAPPKGNSIRRPPFRVSWACWTTQHSAANG